jgi:serine protease Do
MNAGFAPWALDQADDIRHNIKGTLKKLRSARPHFDSNRVVDLIKTFPAIERVSMSAEEFDHYLTGKHSELSSIEGIWMDQAGQYRIGIMRTASTPTEQFVGFILESKNALWDAGMVKVRLTGTAYETTFVARYLMRDHTEIGSTAKLDGGVLSFPLRYRGTDEISNFIRVNSTSGTSGPYDAHPNRDAAAVVSGTGFLCGNDLVATNYHVIKEGTRWEVSFPTIHQSFDLKLMVSDKANDLALLRIVSKAGESMVAKPLTIADSQAARMGEELYTLGFPLGDLLGSGHKVATGILSSSTGLEDDPRLFQISVPTQPGNSGGPVLNERGEVVGILASTLSVEYLYRKQGHVPQNVNFAIKSDYLSLLLKQAASGMVTAPLDVHGLGRADQVSRIAESVGQIRTYK